MRQSSGGARGGEVPASNEMRIKSLIYQGFLLNAPELVSGGILRFGERRGKGFFLFFAPQT